MITNRTKIDYGVVFNSPEGQRVISDLAKFCYLLRPYDVGAQEFCDGKRNVLLYIMSILGIDTAEDFIKISNEVKNDDRNRG